ncbi:hypothetical protein DNTS_018299, partial [Danionella cerebrum]
AVSRVYSAAGGSSSLCGSFDSCCSGTFNTQHQMPSASLIGCRDNRERVMLSTLSRAPQVCLRRESACVAMPVSGEELVCPKFQPNIFDSSRCHDCLRHKHLHTTERVHEEVGAHSGGQKEKKEDEEQESSEAKEDSDGLSLVSSYCDVSRGGRDLEEGSLCILSPECELSVYECDSDDDHSSDSEPESSAYSCSAGTEPDSTLPRLPLSFRSGMTRGWPDAVQGRRDGLGNMNDRPDRDSGYFSLGRASGNRFQNKSPPAPFRHSERGHPIPNNKSPEPKASIPFRNPDLGLPSQRRASEGQGWEDSQQDPPESQMSPLDLSAEIEALAGPRALSPTPFKQAESIGSSSRRNARGGHTSPLRQSPMPNVSQREISHSRSSSPFRHGESGRAGLRSCAFSQGQGRCQTGSSQKTFKSFGSAVGTMSRSASYMDLKGSLRKSESPGAAVGSSVLRAASPNFQSRYEAPAIRKKEAKGFSYEKHHGKPLFSADCSDSRSQSPSRWSPDVRKNEMISSSYIYNNSSAARNNSRHQSPVRRSNEGQTVRKNSEHEQALNSSKMPFLSLSSSPDHMGADKPRSASPVRKGYGTVSQSELRYTYSGRSYERKTPSPSRKNFDAQNLVLKKTEPKTSFQRDDVNSSSGRGHQRHHPMTSMHNSDSRHVSSNQKSRSPSPDFSRTSENRRNVSRLSQSLADHIPLKKNTSERTCIAPYSTGSQPHNEPPWRGSTYSHQSQSVQRHFSPSRYSTEKKHNVSFEKSVGDQSQSSFKKNSLKGQTGTSKPRPRMPSHPINTHSSSQSSLNSDSSHVSGTSSGMNREEYSKMADLPKIKTVLQREGSSLLPRDEGQVKQETSRYKPASHSQSKAPHSDWDELEEEREERFSVSRARSPSPRHPQRASSPSSEHQASSKQRSRDSGHRQPDLLNFKKGWMSKLDDSGEWRKHWFVLTDAGLKYYRDAAAEEIDLKACLKVSEFEVEKNYGFQIQTREGVFTLSAMTAGIRRNWIEILKKNVRPSSSPDLTQLANCCTDKQKPAQRLHSQSEASSASVNTAHNKFDYVELSPVATPTSLLSNQRESGEGQVKDHSQWQEEHSRENDMEPVLSRKGAGHSSEQKRMEEMIEKKWAEFERLPIKSMRSLPLMGSANQALEREVASLKQQLLDLGVGHRGSGAGSEEQGAESTSIEALQEMNKYLRGLGLGLVDRGVGHGEWGKGSDGKWAESRCCELLQKIEQIHTQTLQELEERHTLAIGEMRRERDAVLKEEADATARVVEALQTAHQEELQRLMLLRDAHSMDTLTLSTLQQEEVCSLRRELQCVSERYSQKCVELNRAQQTHSEISRHLEELTTHNQELQERLSEQMGVVRSLVTGQSSEDAPPEGRERSWCEMQVLLRLREGELHRMHLEISRLQNQLHLLTTEKSGVCERYHQVCEELKMMKSRSEREAETLREYMRLAHRADQTHSESG